MDMDFPDVVDQHFSIDGPHDADQIIAALRSAGQLLRYVAHATYPGKGHLPYGPQIYRAVGALNGVVSTAAQVADQLGFAAADVADDPTLYDDRYSVKYPATRTALSLALVLQDEVALALGRARPLLDAAHSLACHLGHNEAA